MVQFSNGWELYLKAMAKAQPFEIQPSNSLDFKWSDFISHCILKTIREISFVKFDLIGMLKVSFKHICAQNENKSEIGFNSVQ